MALFRRKTQDTDVVPAEIQDYYQSEKRERTGVAWLLALVTLVITVLLALALFFGGRWLYRKVVTNDKPNTGQQAPASNQPGNVNAPGDNTDTPGAPAPSAPAPSTPAPSAPAPTAPAPAAPTPGAGAPATGSPSQPATPTTTASPSAPRPNTTGSTPSATTPTTGPTASNLTNTGPGDMVALFVGTTVVATVLHYAVTSKKYHA